MGQPHRIKSGDRVRIKSEITHMYPEARAYNEGIARAVTHDEFGYPLFYIEWDKDHWAYSGEQDRWVLEAHFDLVEEEMAEDKRFNELLKGLGDLVESFASDNEGVSEKSDKTLMEEAGDMDGPTYDEIIDRAAEDAREGEAFIILVARPDTFNGVEMIAPRIYMDSKREDAAMMLEVAMADAVAQTYANLVQRHADLKKDGETGS